MPHVPQSLAAEQCPILKHPRYAVALGPVLASYNTAADAAKTLAEKYPLALQSPDVIAALDKLLSAHATLTTPRFKVGFLGPFQCGKSTILNNLLGQDISAVGVGRACTSVVTRLIVKPGQKPPTLALEYFSTDGYYKRRNTLAEWARLSNPDGQSETQLLEKLKGYTPSSARTSSQRPVRKKDIPYLRAFLQSYEDGKAKGLVRETPLTETVSFADRERLLKHDPSADEETVRASQYLLVSESRISFDTDRIDPELELVDLPGLGSGRSVDDLLTKEFIHQLDGALVFLRADSMDSAEVSEIFTELQTRFRDNLKSRVWVVVNKMDAPERHAKIAAPGKDNTFNVVIDLMKKSNIPLSQVVFGCNGIYESAKSAGGTADRTTALALLKLAQKGDDEAVRGQLAGTPELLGAFDELLSDGSIGLLQRLIKDKVGPSVAGQILSQAKLDAESAASDLQFALELAEKPANEQEQTDARLWENALYALLGELTVGPGGTRGPLFLKLEDYGKVARKALETEFGKLVQDEALAAKSTPELLSQFALDATLMQKKIDAAMTQVVQQVYTDITERLEAKQLPGVNLPGGGEPMGVWHTFRQKDRDDTSWRDRGRPKLHDAVLVERLSDDGLAHTFDGPRYKKLWLDKLRTAAHQLALVVRGRVRHRLDDLRRQVTRKLGPVRV
jgi:GTPase SAR1 family protein